VLATIVAVWSIFMGASCLSMLASPKKDLDVWGKVGCALIGGTLLLDGVLVIVGRWA
jgi:hypothetical protein